MGFGRAAGRTDKVPDILMVGRIDLGGPVGARCTAGRPVDALLLELADLSEDLLESASTALSGLLWGVRHESIARAVMVEKLKAAGADFRGIRSSRNPWLGVDRRRARESS